MKVEVEVPGLPLRRGEQFGLSLISNLNRCSEASSSLDQEEVQHSAVRDLRSAARGRHQDRRPHSCRDRRASAVESQMHENQPRRVISVYTSIHIYIYIYIYTCISKYIYVYIYICICRSDILCVYIYILIYTYLHMVVYVYVFVYVSGCVCVYVYVYMYVYMYMYMSMYLQQYVYIHICMFKL